MLDEPTGDQTATSTTADDPADETTGDQTDPASSETRGSPRTRHRAVSRPAGPPGPSDSPETPSGTGNPDTDEPATPTGRVDVTASFTAPLFQAPEPVARGPKRPEPSEAEGSGADNSTPSPGAGGDDGSEDEAGDDSTEDEADRGDDQGDGSAPRRRRRRRGGRRRRRSGEDDAAGQTTDTSASDSSDGEDADGGTTDDASGEADQPDEASESGQGEGTGGSRRRRRRRRRGDGTDDSSGSGSDGSNGSATEDEISAVTGSTRLEAKKQRRREGREAGRRRAPIVSEAEFLARREAVKREMVIRQAEDLTQIAVVEDDVLVEHYVARESQASMIGNVYLGRVQNVLPSMEAAFIDIGKGRNGVLYAGEVDWASLGNGKERKIEDVLKSGQTVLVQVTKDPVGHKGARLTSQISLAGRFLVFVPGGQTSGISRKLPDTERSRLKNLLKDVLPEDAGVIIRTAAEGATEENLTRDVSALTARWQDIEKKSRTSGAPKLLYEEPDLTIKVVRDLFNEDFSELVIQGGDAWDMINGYVGHVAPDLTERLRRWDDGEKDVFAAYRIDEQIAKAVERKVWLPSGGSLIIDRTEAMTVVDVNTGKFTGSGGNLEETVTKNNLEAAEEIVRQLRLRDIGGIIVIDFIDMVLESNRDLVLRRLVECLGRDRTRHQVAEVTSLGLVQMTRKRIGTGLLEAFSERCEECSGRGVIVHSEPVEPHKHEGSGHRSSGGQRKSKSGKGKDQTKPGKGKDQSKPGKDNSGKDTDQDKPGKDEAEPDTGEADTTPPRADGDAEESASADTGGNDPTEPARGPVLTSDGRTH